MLKINDLKFSYCDRPVHKGLSLQIEQNQYYALAGLNGAGKTTLIKLILDLLRTANRNDILIEGKSSWQLSSRQDVIYLPEKFRLSSNVTALDYFKLLAGIYRQKIDYDNIYRISKTLGFEKQDLGKKAQQYSKGMMQKVGLIGCLSINVPFLILDEPLSGLDPKARLQVKRLMIEQKKQGKTLLYSTHMLADVEELCDSFGILHEGTLMFEGTPRQCMETFEADSLEDAYMRCIDNYSTNI